jgi:NitT/TauT family transport system ATP-binding protein
LTALNFDAVCKSFGEYPAVHRVSLRLEQGRFVAIAGPSGCGKSTLLNLAAGLLAPTAGRIEVLGERLIGLNSRAAYLFQEDALLPWKTVLENAALSLEFAGAADARERAFQWLRRVGLERFAHAFPAQLSGGMKKRAALAQSWIANREILLMDEPFSALDIHTRRQMEEELLQLWTHERRTVLFVTHDLEEAIALADEVAVMSAGPASTLVSRYEIDLPRPRELSELRFLPEFQDLYQSIWRDLRPEVSRSRAR